MNGGEEAGGGDCVGEVGRGDGGEDSAAWRAEGDDGRGGKTGTAERREVRIGGSKSGSSSFLRSQVVI